MGPWSETGRKVDASITGHLSYYDEGNMIIKVGIFFLSLKIGNKKERPIYFFGLKTVIYKNKIRLKLLEGNLKLWVTNCPKIPVCINAKKCSAVSIVFANLNPTWVLTESESM
jgi:hypothetical protein